MKNLRIIVILSFGLFLPLISAAGSLSAPMSLNTTQVLPEGVRSARIGGVTTMVDSWYDGDGLNTSVASPMIQDLSYERLLSAESDEALKLNIESQLRAKGIALSTIAGTSLSDINTRVTATIPSVAMGVTEWWTLGVAVPVVYSQISQATSFAGTAQLQNVVDEFASKGRGDTNIIEQKLTDVIATELSNKGYVPLENRELTEVGDINLVSKLRLHNGYGVKWSLTNRLVIPTGRTRSINRLVDPAAGDGQWDIATASNIEVPITSKFRFLNEVGYIIQLPDIQDTRIPVTRNEILSADMDPGAYRDAGDIIHTTLGFMYEPFNFLTLGAGYSASYKQEDRWSGSIVAQERYDLIGQFSNQYMHAAIIQVGLSSVAAYKAKKFSVPMGLSLVYSQVFDAKNVRNDPVWAANVSLFF